MKALLPRSSVFCPAVFLSLVLFALAAAPAFAAVAGDRGRVLVLRGGQVLEGDISRSEDRYRVVLPHGEILIHAVDVESCCRDLDEAYRLKRSLMQVGDVYSHIELAKWCLQNDLLSAAAIELSDAEAADSQNPMVAHLKRRLQAAMNPPELYKKPAFEMQNMPSRTELDKLARAMPSDTLETFTSTVQPLLLNSCSTHDCHGPHAQSQFRLLRTHPGRSSGRRLTQRNLHAVMQWIDHDKPASSPLLTKPIQPHGPRQAAIFDDTNVDRYRQLVRWVGNVVQNRQVQSLNRPNFAHRKAGSRVDEVLTTVDGVQQAAHTTPWLDTLGPASGKSGVEPAVFESELPNPRGIGSPAGVPDTQKAH